MVVLTLLLGGLVALNVAALRSTITVSDVNTKVRHLQQQNRLEQADISRPQQRCRGSPARPRATACVRARLRRVTTSRSDAQHPITPPAPAAANPG